MSSLLCFVKPTQKLKSFKEISDSVPILPSMPSCWSRIPDAYLFGSRCSCPWESECPEGLAHTITISALPVYIADQCPAVTELKSEGRDIAGVAGVTAGKWLKTQSFCFPASVISTRFFPRSCKTGTMTPTKPHQSVYYCCYCRIMFVNVAQTIGLIKIALSWI